MKDPVKDKLKRFELFDRFGAADFYPTIGSAVDGLPPRARGRLEAIV